MKGESVVVTTRTEVGRDPGNAPIYETTTTTVHDVLVAPGPRADVTDSTRPEGVRIAWNLSFPKTFTSSLRGAEVSVRGEDPCPVVGDPKPYTPENTPTRWWMPVELEDVHG